MEIKTHDFKEIEFDQRFSYGIITWRCFLGGSGFVIGQRKSDAMFSVGHLFLPHLCVLRDFFDHLKSSCAPVVLTDISVETTESGKFTFWMSRYALIAFASYLYGQGAIKADALQKHLELYDDSLFDLSTGLLKKLQTSAPKTGNPCSKKKLGGRTENRPFGGQRVKVVLKKPSFVYLISDSRQVFCKIGVTTNIDGRLKVLQTANPMPLVVLATISGGISLESELHRVHAKDRLNGEWFKLTDSIKESFEAYRLLEQDTDRQS